MPRTRKSNTAQGTRLRRRRRARRRTSYRRTLVLQFRNIETAGAGADHARLSPPSGEPLDSSTLFATPGGLAHLLKHSPSEWRITKNRPSRTGNPDHEVPSQMLDGGVRVADRLRRNPGDNASTRG